MSIETENVALDEAFSDQHEVAAAGDYLKVTVSDTGCGMAPEVVEKTFEPFFTTKDVGEGSGLGLSMVYGFVKQSEGYIIIDSEVDYGTAICLYLPRSLDAITEAAIESVLHTFEPGAERILVDEDDETVREIPVVIFQQQGYEIVGAGDGKEAIKHLKSDQSFDLLFTDVVLPGGINGVEIADEARYLQQNIKVLYTSGYAEDAVSHDGLMKPGEHLIAKPYHRAELLQLVRTTLDRELAQVS